jgi:HlyD family secretion protein
VDIGEIDVVLLQVGQSAKLEVDAFRDRKFAGTVTEIANSSRLAASAGGQSQEAIKFEVKIRIDEPAEFRPGMSVTAEIQTRSRTNVLAVPIQSVTTRLPKPPEKPGAAKKPGSGETNAEPDKVASGSETNPPAGTAATKPKPNEPPKPIEVVFLVENDRAKMTPVERGISDDSYTEIVKGVEEGQEVISGGYKAISRDLEDGKKTRISKATGPEGEEGKEANP